MMTIHMRSGYGEDKFYIEQERMREFTLQELVKYFSLWRYDVEQLIIAINDMKERKNTVVYFGINRDFIYSETV